MPSRSAQPKFAAWIPRSPCSRRSCPQRRSGRRAVPELLSAVVKVKAFVPGDSRTAETLGREREGSGIVIDQAGLILTIGYLMVEAQGAEVTGADGRTVPAQIIGYDHEFGLRPAARQSGAAGQAAGPGALERPERARPRADRQPWRPGHGRPGLRRRQTRVRRIVGIPARRSDLHGAAASGMERRGPDRPRRPPGRRRLADRRRHDRHQHRPARQHVRADRPPQADPRRPDQRRQGVGPGEAVARRQHRGAARPAVRDPRVAGEPGRARRHPGRATSSSASAARRRATCRTSIARYGRAAPPASRCRSASCKAPRCAR